MRMNLKILLTFAMPFAAAVMSSPSASADNYYPIIEEGKVWEYSGAYTKGADAGMALHSYKFDGTVTVNGKEYHGFTMFKSEYYKWTPDADQPVYEGPVERTGPTTFFREEEGKVYILTKNNYIYKSPVDAENTFDGPVTSEEYGEYLRYDFTLQNGQTLYMPYEDGISGQTNFVRVVIEEPVVIEGTQRIRMSFDGVPESELPVIYQMSEPFQGYVIEGIGSTEGGDLAVFSPSIPGIPNAIDGPTYESALSCVYNAAGEVIYGKPFGTEYHPIIEEGKVWEYSGIYQSNEFGGGIVRHSFKFDGTVTVNGKEYHGFTMFRSDYYKGTAVIDELVYAGSVDRTGPTNFFREEEGKVYILTRDNSIFHSSTTAADTFDGPVTSDSYGEYLRYDFTLKDGDPISLPVGSSVDGEMNHLRVAIQEPMVIEGTERIRMTFDAIPESEWPEPYYFSLPYDGSVIEGIGANKGGDLAMFGPKYTTAITNAVNGPNEDSCLACVYNPEGEVIYGSRFKIPNKLIQENKVWNYAQAVDSKDVDFYRFQISYDTFDYLGDSMYNKMKVDNIVGYKRTADRPDGVEVKRVDAEASFYMNEYGGKVRIYNRAYGSKAFKESADMPQEFVLYDFTLGEGDSYETYCGMNRLASLEAESIETVTNCGKEWRKFNFGDIECEGRVSSLCAVEGVGFLSGELGSTLVYFNDHAFTTDWKGQNAQYLPIPTFSNVGLVNVTDRDGNVLFDPAELGLGFNSVESVTADRMTLLSANGIVTAVSESGSEVRMTVYGIDGTVRAEVTGTGEASVNVSALGRGIYTVRATDGDTLRVIKIRG